MEAGLRRAHSASHVTLADWLTVERAGYGLATVVGLAVRLIGLSWQPLGPAEAAQALPAWAAANGHPADLTGVSPLLYSLQRLVFTPFGASDALARWWPALLGGLSPLLFYPLRHRLGRGAALMAAFLWAVSPLAVFTSRLGLGYGLVATLALALLVAFAGGSEKIRERRPVWLAICLGLLVAAGSGAYTVLLVGLAAAWFWRADLSAFWQSVRASRRQALVGGLLALVLGSTFFLLTPEGLAAAIDLLGSWVSCVLPGPGDYTPWEILRRLLLSEPLLVGFGLAGLGMAWRRRDRFALFLGSAAGLALLVSLVGRGRHPADLSLVVLPLAMLAGQAVAGTLRGVWSWRREVDPWLLVGLTLALLMSAGICLPSASTPMNNPSWRQLYTAVGVATVTLAVLLWLAYGYWGSWQTVARALPVVPLVVGGLWCGSQLSALNYDRGAWRQPAALTQVPASGLGDLLAELRNLSALHGGGAREARLDLVLPVGSAKALAPTLRWHLRDFVALRVLSAVPPEPAPLVITPADKQLSPAGNYTGAEFTVLQSWRPESLLGFDAWLRWVLYREAKTPAEEWKVVLWVDRSAQ